MVFFTCFLPIRKSRHCLVIFLHDPAFVLTSTHQSLGCELKVRQSVVSLGEMNCLFGWHRVTKPWNQSNQTVKCDCFYKVTFSLCRCLEANWARCLVYTTHTPVLTYTYLFPWGLLSGTPQPGRNSLCPCSYYMPSIVQYSLASVGYSWCSVAERQSWIDIQTETRYVNVVLTGTPLRFPWARHPRVR